MHLEIYFTEDDCHRFEVDDKDVVRVSNGVLNFRGYRVWNMRPEANAKIYGYPLTSFYYYAVGDE